MLNLLKNASIYFLMYSGVFFVAFWLTFFLMITVQAFWKLFLFFGIVAVAIATAEYVEAGGKLKDLFKFKTPRKPTLSIVK